MDFDQCAVVWLVVAVIAVVSTVQAYPGDLSGAREYCKDEYFNVTCPVGHVILMETALYGRMNRGRCITGSYGKESLGCSVDVLDFMHGKCSARRHCTVFVSDPALNRLQNTCHRDLAYYLLAKHTCVAVAHGSYQQCRRHRQLLLEVTSSNPGYISSMGNVGRDVGTANCPWVIRTLPGQTIKLTTMAFGDGMSSSGDMLHSAQDNVCYIVGTAREGVGEAQDVRLCVGSVETVVYQTSGDVLTLTVKSASAHELPPFIFKYSAVGCALMEAPPGGWVKITRGVAEIRCNNSADTWFMSCTDTRWEGQMGNCSDYDSKQASGHIQGSGSSFPYGILIVVAIGVALGVFIGGLLLSLAALYMKRNNRHFDEGTDIRSGEAGEAASYSTHQIPTYQADTGSPLINKPSPGHPVTPAYTEENPQSITVCPKHDLTYGRSCSHHPHFPHIPQGPVVKTGHLYESPQLS